MWLSATGYGTLFQVEGHTRKKKVHDEVTKEGSIWGANPAGKW